MISERIDYKGTHLRHESRIRLSKHFKLLHAMIKHYLKNAWRALLGNKGFSVINITGLAIGMASAILIILWLQNMMTTDRFYKNEENLYILCNRDAQQGNVYAWQYTPKILGPTLTAEYPEVQDIGRYGTQQILFSRREKKITAGKSTIPSSGTTAIPKTA